MILTFGIGAPDKRVRSSDLKLTLPLVHLAAPTQGRQGLSLSPVVRHMALQLEPSATPTGEQRYV